ncbi:MAG TPA: MFS transporter [Bacteroidota bacterium]|jgi:ACS family hexuronate transporter-like MFS transporter|nr:MFS transporter [Bacteroidota bacterium]
MSFNQEKVSEKIGKYRWTICALLFFATTINYIDRQVLGILAPELQHEIGWNEIEYGYIVTTFQAAYALGLLFVGRIIDKIGTKIGFSIAISLWSIAAMGHALVRSVIGFASARFFLGLGESGNFPAAIKATAEWFPKKERALATGIFNSGANIGAVFAPLIVPWLTLSYGWQSSFIITGAIGFIWLIFWLYFYEIPEKHKKVSKKEIEYINSDQEEVTKSEKIPWTRIVAHKEAWAFIIGKFLTDPIWWFYLYWLPKFLNKNYGLTLDKLGLPLIIIYMMTTIGSIGGGWLSSMFINMGWDINKSRKVVMLICALLIVPIIFAAETSNLWVAVLLIGIAAASHQGWSANIFTTASDMFPKHAVGSIVGFGGMAGSIGGMLFSTGAGFILEFTGSYMTLFIISGSAYLVALGIFHLLVPRIKSINI